MLALDLAVMLGLVLIAGAVLFTGFEFPENEIAGLEWTALTIGLVVIGAPLMEETAFRSWLSGRPGHVLAFILVAGALAVVVGGMEPSSRSPDQAAASVLVMAGAIALAGFLVWLLRKRPPMNWFARVFPLFFWLSTLGFALIHLFNYTEGALAVLLPLVVPQLVAGSIFAYARVHYGLWASVLLHALHNGAAVSVVLLATELGA